MLTYEQIDGWTLLLHVCILTNALKKYQRNNLRMYNSLFGMKSFQEQKEILKMQDEFC